MIYETQEEVAAALAFWQKALRLQDWHVTVEIKRSRDMGGEYTRGGEVFIKDSRKAARINLLDPVDYSPSCWEPQDMEYFLVHELLHLHTSCIRQTDGESEDNTQEEQAVDSIASALVSLHRGIVPHVIRKDASSNGHDKHQLAPTRAE
jgi:hypothetical protein